MDTLNPGLDARPYPSNKTKDPNRRIDIVSSKIIEKD